LLVVACGDANYVAPAQTVECPPLPAKGPTLSPAFPSVAVGDTVRVRASLDFTCPGTPPISFVWSSVDSLVARVDSSGLVTGRRAGTTTLQARSPQAVNVIANLSVTVRAP
jgi:uncharacterized protein YjdB